jgi:WD40 repeat protein
MAFLAVDQPFTDALDAAWQTSALPAEARCVVWSLLERDTLTPLSGVTGGSLGGAFGVALDELHRQSGRLGRYRLRRLDAKTAVTAGLDHQRRLTTVEGYPLKLDAAAKAALPLVVVAKDDEETLKPQSARTLPVEAAATLSEAVRLTRTRLNRRLVTAVAVVLALLAGGATAYTLVIGASDAAEQRSARAATAADLAARAVSSEHADPRTAGLLALAAYRIDPGSARAVDAMRQILSDNQDIARSWQASPVAVDAIAVDDRDGRLYTGGDDPSLKVWNLKTGTLLGRIDGPVKLLAIDPHTPALAASDGTRISLYDTTTTVPTLLGALPAAGCVQPGSSLVSAAFSSNGVDFVAAWSDMAVATYDLTTRTQVSCWRLPDLATKDQLGSPDALDPVGSVTLDAAITDSQALLLLNNNRVLSVDLRTHRVSVELQVSDIPGVPLMMRATDSDIAVATRDGVMVWDRKARKQIAYPAGGITSRPTALELLNDEVLVAGSQGTALVPLYADARRSWATDTHGPRGGPAALATIGTSNTIAVGEPGGRVDVLSEGVGPLTLPLNTSTRTVTFTSTGSLVFPDTSFGDDAWGLYRLSAASLTPDQISTVMLDMSKDTYRFPDSWRPIDAGGVAVTGPGAVAVVGRELLTAPGGERTGRLVAFYWPPGNTTVWWKVLAPASGATWDPAGHSAPRVALAAGGSVLLARIPDGTAEFWDPTGNERGTLGLRSGTTSMAVFGDRAVIAEGQGQSADLVLVDVATRAVLARVPAPGVEEVAASADGRSITTLSEDNRVQQRDAALRPIGTAVQLPAAGRASALAETADGSRVAVSQGAQVEVYDLATGLPAMPPLDEASGLTVQQLAWSPDGSRLAGAALPQQAGTSGLEPGPVDVWQIREAEWTAQMCQWTGGGLSAAQWALYVGHQIPFMNLCQGS